MFNLLRLLIVSSVLMIVSACGFEPLLGKSGGNADVAEQLAAIRIEPIPERSGQVLRNALLDRLTPQGQAPGAQYVLRIRLLEPRQTLLLRRDDVISRSSYSGQASYEVRDAQGQRLFSGSSAFTTDYEITSSEFATRASRENARDRVMELIADDMRNQLALGFRQRQNSVR